MFYLQVLTLVLLAAVSVNSAYRRVCYYGSWAKYRKQAGRFTPEKIDANLCTHIIYTFAKLRGNRLVAGDWEDESTAFRKGMFERFTDLKKRNSALKTMIGVGGWTAGSDLFSQMVATNSSRQEFTTSAIIFLRDHKFDGIDMDWEFPANRGSPPEDKQKFGELLKTMREAFDSEARTSRKPRLILSAATAAGKNTTDSAYDIPVMVKNVDMINLMTYDLHGSWDNKTGHNSPLYEHDGEIENFSLDWAASYWVKQGVPEAMINIGIGLYGRSFTLTDPSKYDVGAPVTGPGKAGRFTMEEGFVAYFEVCDMFQTGATKYYISDQLVPYVVKGSQWVGYDDADSLKPKMKYVKDHNFGGITAWAIDLDDFSGMCGQGKYPLLNAIKYELNNSTGTSGTGDKFCRGKKDGHYVDPDNCTKLYICYYGLGTHQVCQDGTVFNGKTLECDLPIYVPDCQISSSIVVGRR